jgi:glycosyltransferase involved in cell wall biosynthesis
MYGSEPSKNLINKIKVCSKSEAKAIMNFPLEKKTIYCGYNGHRSQRHLDIINELKKIDNTRKQKYHLVLHCSYGLEEDYHLLIKDALDKSGFSFSLITDFYTLNDLAVFRIACDIFINVQDTDALSATMIESLSSGAIVIVGKWLKYYEIDLIGAFYKSISNFSELSEVMNDIEINWSEYKTLSKNNNKLGEQLLSWDKLSDTWLNLYTL